VNHADPFEHREVPVDRALREVRAPLEELGDRERLPGIVENVDQGAAP
jgi:hypothetical protein